MLGAIIGDIVGSPFEFDQKRHIAQTPFELFSMGAHFTDDTVMTMAIAAAIIRYQDDGNAFDEQKLAEYCKKSMIEWGRKYPFAGYGGRFGRWLWKKDPEPYESYGNGSAMRVSPAAFLYDDLEDVLTAAKASAMPSHNHPEGIKGAQAIAYMIWAALHHKMKAEMKAEVEKRFGYDLNFTIDQIRPAYHMDETCQGSVPQAIVAFLESESFEHCLRHTISLGGDADTTACMAGAIAEAYYGVPVEIRDKAMDRIPKDMREVLLLEYAHHPDVEVDPDVASHQS